MNHHWAKQYAADRFNQLAQEARGDQLLRMANLPPNQPSDSAAWLLDRLSRRVVAVLTAVALLVGLVLVHPG